MNTNNMHVMFEEKVAGGPAEQKGANGHENAVISLCRKLNSEQMIRLIRISPAGYVDDK
ncbi:hypothetical protein SAMN04488589_1228 [Methanolobus vulcani]|jgi:hypothetical protein|uniref:Uncharacterized protein n=1 Tax=Methanolobus vulcani TaxID=38026 RepID=A0A7Z7FCB5_9EURY|nr:hypothetical protein [Methanolobus vulcani]MDK2826740.1 hypothetical protein [Methanolobus sp.]MDK2947590.1 hypothetical protein [Methanolobus sp.]SDF72022.1 hypothetical protein SAMN04488589_1228 [Methanolobus vulcani]